MPNVLLILCDQLRADFLHVYGGPDLTPNIDRLAGAGTVFTRAYCAIPVCITTRTTLLTGMHPTTCPNRVPDGVPTVAGLLADAGWHAAALGKMHMEPVRGPNGFDELVLSEDTGNGMFLDDYHPWLARQGITEWAHGLDNYDILSVESDLPAEKTVTHWNGEQAVEFLRRRAGAGGAFYGVVSFVKPHPPYDPPRPFSRLVAPEDAPRPIGLGRAREDYPAIVQAYSESFGDREVRAMGMLQRIRAHYLGLVAQIDGQIGRILDALDETGLAADTLVIFSSDHGDFHGDHHLYMKFLGYESAAHVPLIARGPGFGPARSDIPVSHLDVVPTILRYCGRPVPAQCQGRDLAELLASGGEERDGVLVSLALCSGYTWATRRHKLTIWPDHSEELFDLATDPHEERNLAPSEPALAADLRRALLAELARLDPLRVGGLPPLLDAGVPVLPHDGSGAIAHFSSRYMQHRTPPQYMGAAEEEC